jgi:predicted RNA-binding Zn-ribbon protein involved in translation (DUF1610 family)
MEKYMKTTGKVYSKSQLVKCSSCGEIYEKKHVLNNESKCPSCGNVGFDKFQRTLSSVKEEKELNNGK